MEVRNVLYMSTLVATRYNPLIQAQYQELLKRGKVKLVLSLSKDQVSGLLACLLII